MIQNNFTHFMKLNSLDNVNNMLPQHSQNISDFTANFFKVACCLGHAKCLQFFILIETFEN